MIGVGERVFGGASVESLFRTEPKDNVLHISKEWAGYEHNKVKCNCRDCGEAKYFIQKCGHRDCPVCRRREFIRLLRKYRGPLWHHLKKNGIKTDSLKLLTLTIKNIPVERSSEKDINNLRNGVRILIKSFAKLRRWKRYQLVLIGGLRVVEIMHKKWKKNKDDEWIRTDEWNIHMHVLCQGAYQEVCCQEMKDANKPGEIQAVENNSTVVADMAARQITHGEVLAAQGVSIGEVKDQTQAQWDAMETIKGTVGEVKDSLWGHKVKTASLTVTVSGLVTGAFLYLRTKFGGGTTAKVQI